MKTSSPEKKNLPIYIPPDWHCRVSTIAKRKRITIGEYIIGLISTGLSKDEIAMANQYLADQNRHPSKAK